QAGPHPRASDPARDRGDERRRERSRIAEPHGGLEPAPLEGAAVQEGALHRRGRKSTLGVRDLMWNTSPSCSRKPWPFPRCGRAASTWTALLASVATPPRSCAAAHPEAA